MERFRRADRKRDEIDIHAVPSRLSLLEQRERLI